MKRVLLVDDHAIVRSIIVRLRSPEGIFSSNNQVSSSNMFSCILIMIGVSIFYTYRAVHTAAKRIFDLIVIFPGLSDRAPDFFTVSPAEIGDYLLNPIHTVIQIHVRNFYKSIIGFLMMICIRLYFKA